MLPLRSLSLSLSLVVHFLSARASPACAHHWRSSSASACLASCEGGWGWPGMVRTDSRWGPVIRPLPHDGTLQMVVAMACGAASQISANQPPDSSSALWDTTVGGPVAPSAIHHFNTPSSSLPTINTEHPQGPASRMVDTLAEPTPPSTSAANPPSTTSPSLASPSSLATAMATSHPTSAPPQQSFPPATVPGPPSTGSASPLASPAPVPPPVAIPSVLPVPPTVPVSPVVPTFSASSSPLPIVSPDQSNINAYLAAHNTFRTQHGASPLSWNTTLAQVAQQWANQCVFRHSGRSLGENLAAGTGNYSPSAAIQAWEDEAPQYNPQVPQPSHFTQVVWKSTTSVGCAVASCTGIFDASFGPANFYVCEYYPAGNVLGEFSTNVQI